MKKIVTLLAMVACMTTVTAANPVIKNLGDSKYCIEIGNLSMTINGAGGGKDCESSQIVGFVGRQRRSGWRCGVYADDDT